jgi:prolyl oligopeptidase
MRWRMSICCLTIWCLTILALYAADKPVANSPAQPPKAKIANVVTDYFGTKVPDPYRWMEAGVEDPAVMDFLRAQNDYTRAVLAPLAAARDKLLARLAELDNAVPTVRSWQRAGTDLFYLETAPGATTASLMVRGEGGEVRKLLDPIQFEEKGSHTAIDYFAPSYDARYVLAGVSLGGSENSTIRVIDVKTGHLLPDTITRTQYAGPSWRLDSQSLLLRTPAKAAA